MSGIFFYTISQMPNLPKKVDFIYPSHLYLNSLHQYYNELQYQWYYALFISIYRVVETFLWFVSILSCLVFYFFCKIISNYFFGGSIGKKSTELSCIKELEGGQCDCYMVIELPLNTIKISKVKTLEMCSKCPNNKTLKKTCEKSAILNPAATPLWNCGHVFMLEGVSMCVRSTVAFL